MANPRRPFVCAFDLDGTLVHSLPDICGNVNAVRQELELEPLPEATLRGFIGKGVEHLMAGAFPGVPLDRHEALTLRFRAHYLATPRRGGWPYPGVTETLAMLFDCPDVRVVIATNKNSLVAEKTLAEYFPDFRFPVVLGPDRVREHKPSALHLLTAVDAAGGHPEEAIFVGDDPVDEACARGAGVTFFAAGYGFGGLVPAEAPSLSSLYEVLRHPPLAARLHPKH